MLVAKQSAPLESSAGFSPGTITSQVMRHWLAPSERAASSSERSSFSLAATRVTMARGREK